ncbi:hypothetical protein Poly24_25640 [Rosistilla carotiformis]|uniref:Bacterial Ig-like domain (Group 2) n=1 Tax=Rosistilla carotiformis TaxID=2528017 RepID=A0A518JTH8_9BACT|nr:DUF1549 domain-containing protein [Rosistilla carotiformis]QDV68851.1 hypothetical protein Poly24_25640 [Rosistilla carotiformis]
MTHRDLNRLRRQVTRCGFALLAPLFLFGSVHAVESEPTVSFINDVVPVLTKSGCNTGVCHAKAGGGQNGFQLSLFGFEPQEDYDHLVLEGRGRRLFPTDPDRSLLLVKAVGEVPHGGGVRLDPKSEGYATLRRWIAQGAPNSTDAEPTLTSIEVLPGRETVAAESEQQLKSLAHYSDGSSRDVTELAVYECNDRAMAEVSETGLVRTESIPGKVAVMVRYQGQVAVFNGSIPLGAPVEQLPESRNFIDDFVFDNLKTLGIPPSPVCDDATFIRRVSLDIAGRIPTDEESRAFLANEAPDKRDQLIDDLLRSPDYADYFANKWTSLLKNRRDDASDITSNFAFHSWIRDSLLANTPYDQLARELLAATGTIIANPPVAWYKRVKQPQEQIEDVAQLFLGVRMQCAQCHHHPFERWSQDDYYGLAAFFSQVGRKPTDTRGEDLIFHKRGIAGSKNIKTGMTVPPAALGDDVGTIPADEDPRLRLANWMSRPENPFFAKSLVNRYWKHFFARGLIEPEDDIRDTNPPTNPELLAALEEHFLSSGFDLKELVRTITRSNAYQLSATPNEHNIADRQNYSRFYPRRMQAEVMLDSIDQMTGATTSFANLPAGTRAIALPDNSYNRASPFLKVFGRPESSSVCECERVQSASLAQSLHLLNAADIKGKLATANGRADQLSKAETSDAEKISKLYLAAFARPPREEELQVALDYLAQPSVDAAGKPIDAKVAARDNYQDLVWALINTKEFLFNH